MSEEKKNVEQQLPGQNFSSGSVTLFQIVESKGTKLGHANSSDENAIVSDRDKELLANAIPAKAFDKLVKHPKNIYQQAKNIIRGKSYNHTPTGIMVTVVEANASLTKKGTIQHLVMPLGSKKKFLVADNNLGGEIMALTIERITEMMSDLEDFETSWTPFETEFLMNVKGNMEKFENDFKFFGKQEETFEKIYDKYVKKASV